MCPTELLFLYPTPGSLANPSPDYDQTWGVKSQISHSYFFNLKSPYVWKAAIWLQKSLQQKVKGVLEIKFTGQFKNDKK